MDQKKNKVSMPQSGSVKKSQEENSGLTKTEARETTTSANVKDMNAHGSQEKNRANTSTQQNTNNR